MRFRRIPWIAVGLLTAGAEAPTPTPIGSSDDLYNTGKQLFDQFAPPDVKEEYEFPSKEDWDRFAGRLQHALQGDSLEDLAGLLPEARAALVTLRATPGAEDYADLARA